jgi:hypothetical protein
VRDLAGPQRRPLVHAPVARDRVAVALVQHLPPQRLEQEQLADAHGTIGEGVERAAELVDHRPLWLDDVQGQARGADPVDQVGHADPDLVHPADVCCRYPSRSTAGGP